jgi:DNA polymerase III, gamma/tau subunits
VSNPKGTPAIRVDNIRELERLAALRPAEAPCKVFIVDGAETMTGAAPQAFLKTLEEPPARTVIILILSQARALPATVLSRCQIVRFRPRPAEGVVALLPAGAGPERERALGWLAQAQSRGPEAILQIGEAWDVIARLPRARSRPAGCGTGISSVPTGAVIPASPCSPGGPLPAAAPSTRSWPDSPPAGKRGRPSKAMSHLDSPSRCY